MAYVAGESLRARLARVRHLPVDQALRITEQVAAALHVAHDQGTVHRDIKPENLLLDGDHVYVADFGVAKALIETGGERLTSTGFAIGTPAYRRGGLLGAPSTRPISWDGARWATSPWSGARWRGPGPHSRRRFG